MFPCFLTRLSVVLASRWVIFTPKVEFTSYNGLTCIPFMGLRKNENETFLSSSIDNAHDEQQDHNVTKMKIPNFFNVTLRVNIGTHTSGKDTGEPVTADFDIISKEPFPKDWNIVEIKSLTLMFTNTCPKCGQQGIPRINRKNTKDYTHYRNHPQGKEVHRLSYWHKVEGAKAKACYIASFNMNEIIDTRKGEKRFTKTRKISDSIEVVDYIFPNYIIKNISCTSLSKDSFV